MPDVSAEQVSATSPLLVPRPPMLRHHRYCCANKLHSAEAEQRFKEASLLKWQEDYFSPAIGI